MPSFNKIMMIGNLTRDPTSKTLPSNTTVTEFGIACNRKFKTAAGEEREDVCFVDCEAFGKLGDTIAKFCQKGKPLFVEGRLHYSSWQDQQGGKRSKISIVVEGFQFLGSRDQGEPATRGGGAAPQNREGSPFGDKPPEFTEQDCPF